METLTSTQLSPSFRSGAFPKARMDAMAKFAHGFRQSRMDSYTTPALWEAERKAVSTMDAADSLYIARQLEEIRAGLFEIKYGLLKADRFVPFNTSIDRGANEYTVRAVDHSATPVPARAGESNIPTLRMRVTSQTAHFESWFLAYEYTMQEAHAAAYTGLPLSANLAMFVRERQARTLDSLVLVGDATGITPFKGLFTLTLQASAGDTGVLVYSTPTDGTGSATNFEAKSSDQVIRDLAGGSNLIITNSLEIEQPDTTIIPVSTDVYIQNTRVGDGTSWTIKKFFKENHPEITLERSSLLEGLGASGTNAPGTSAPRRMISYKNDPLRGEALVSVLFDQLAPQFHGMGVKTITEIRTAGFACYLPKAFCVTDGV